MLVTAVERRRRALPEIARAAVEGSDGFWALVDAGYVSLRRPGHHRHEIVGHKYVGRALVGELELVIREKAPGTLRALVSAATGAELRIEPAEAPATEFDVVSRHLMREFVRAAGHYAAKRRRPRFAYFPASGPTLGGSLEMAETVRLHASGRTHHFAYSSGRVIRDEPLDRVALAALEELDRSAAALRLDADTLYEARWLSAALEEVRDENFLLLSPGDYLEMADDIERDTKMLAENRDLARLAAVALLHRGFEAHGETHGTVPRAWFVDLEILFEQAIRETLRELLKADRVDRGEPFERRLFTGGADRSRTHPDIVVHRHGVVRATGDVKYKTLSVALDGVQEEDSESAGRHKKEGRPDIYQLLVHAESVDADLAFLVFVSEDTYESRYLGESPTGLATWTAQVRPASLREDLARFATEMDLLVPTPSG